MNKPYSPRQQREVDYHRAYAQKHQKRVETDIDLDVVLDTRRRWWNAYWSTYDILHKRVKPGQRVLVVGCGFGEDACRLSKMGAEVHAFDISPEIIAVATARAANFGYASVRFSVMASEKLEYPDDYFDMIFCLDILHHVDIPATLQEFKRVIKDGGRVIGDELYTHSCLQKVRESRFIEKVLYPRMRRYIYQDSKPYITEDEHKIDEDEFRLLQATMTSPDVQYFNIFIGRLLPDRYAFAAKVDRFLMKCLGGFGRYVAGRVLFDGVLAK
ncbi:class I SAM-dependent methyltransferase [Kordiimonas marina]|uniref:class I SAM-dependent methyltransferase n=1 Tax=Kordiimonas marina TaxID=2872312 RepID=UPI001FF25BF7|nr:class I SAM-dependent methyltransferase [Kordiimonas marina]MCJ9427844.1 class I SAM-dependent methyltransferase [Kordiimonas marina]